MSEQNTTTLHMHYKHALDKIKILKMSSKINSIINITNTLQQHYKHITYILLIHYTRILKTENISK